MAWIEKFVVKGRTYYRIVKADGSLVYLGSLDRIEEMARRFRGEEDALVSGEHIKDEG